MQDPAVLFVCLGNICRSPSAEGVFRHRLEKAGIDGIRVDGAGTGPWHVGKPPDPRAQAVARRRGIDISTQRARQVSLSDFSAFTHVFAMDRHNLATLRQMAPVSCLPRVRLLLDLLPGQALREVPDPYNGDEQDFEQMLDLLELAADALVREFSRARTGMPNP